MYCLKCGRETEEGQVFCESCREIMKKYPVKPRTPVLLPRHSVPAAPRKSRRKQPLPVEEQMERLHRVNRLLLAALCVTLALLLGAGYLSVRYLLDQKPFRPGQNYSPMATTAPAEPGNDLTPVP